ncbi:MAG: ferrochelatase [Deltaproteobacteria bacterium]|nr:ferrochelatase [Deltaproteobacteria bacterium]MBW2124067.1 ferrochelatase [Deltaproteobacteria bacterium]
MSNLCPDAAVLVMSFGGPSRMEEVEDFLERFLGKRPLPEERVAAIKEKYRLIGGGSPLAEITRRQAEAIESELAGRGCNIRVAVGMRFSEPSVEHAVGRLAGWGIRKLAALPLTPHRSRLSTGPYFTALKEAVEQRKAGFEVLPVAGWHTHPLFLQALEERINEGLSLFAHDSRERVEIIFSAHSLPEMSVAGDPYVEEILETIRGVSERIGQVRWHLAFQSKAPGPGPWLGPDVAEVMTDLSAKGRSSVLVVPVGFVSDHLETLYDLDIEYRNHAEALGMEYERSPSLNDSSTFIRALAEVVLERLEKEAGANGPGIGEKMEKSL